MSDYHKIESAVSEVTLDLNYEHQYILDLGGGGEGVIGQLFGTHVISLDKKKEELEELKTESIKMVGDMRETSFIDEQFSMITAFFSFMYMSKNDVVETIKEVKRILKPGGSIHIWDVNFPDEFVSNSVYVQYLKIKCPKKEISTGYGAGYVSQVRNKKELLQLIEEADLDILVDKDITDDVYEVVVMKL